MRCRLALTLLFPFAAAQLAYGGDAAVLWSTKVQGIFDIHCVKCHGPIEQKMGLELDTPEAALKGSEDGAVLVPGQPEESSLFLNLLPKADPHMPPKKQLTEAEREAVRAWIAAMSAAPKPDKPRRAPHQFDDVTQAIDTLIAEGWEERGVQPAVPVPDATWCRRLYLDLAGRIPTSAEADEFLKAAVETRRGALVDKLLASEEYVVRMRELWDTFLMGRGKRVSAEDRRKSSGWWAYLEDAFRKNRPWNETVHDFLAARPDKPEMKGASWFLYERKNEFQRIAEAVSPVIYGTKIDCAQCHDHPLAREIKQAHYWGLVTAFNRGKNVEGNSTVVAESAIGGFNNFTNLKKESQPAVISLLSGKTLSEAWPAGDQKEIDSDDKYLDPAAKPRVPKYSRREAFADAATKDNPLLARAFVNRMWSVYTGRGIVHPADEMSGRNVPSHPELLEWLAKDFATHNYDIRRVVRGIALSRVYALSATKAAPEAFAGALERPLTAEQISRSWRVAAGLKPADDGLRRAVITAMPEVLPKNYNATFQQAQFLTNSPETGNVSKAARDSLNARLAALQDNKARAREIVLTVYGREPDAEELTQAEAFLNSRAENPEDGIRDFLWALMTSAEFLNTP